MRISANTFESNDYHSFPPSGSEQQHDRLHHSLAVPSQPGPTMIKLQPLHEFIYLSLAEIVAQAATISFFLSIVSKQKLSLSLECGWSFLA